MRNQTLVMRRPNAVLLLLVAVSFLLVSFLLDLFPAQQANLAPSGQVYATSVSLDEGHTVPLKIENVRP